MQSVICMQSNSTFLFPCKIFDFQHIDKLTCNLHLAYCVLIEFILVNLVRHIIHSIRLHRCYKFCLSITWQHDHVTGLLPLVIWLSESSYWQRGHGIHYDKPNLCRVRPKTVWIP